MDMFGLTRDMLVAAVSPINKTPLIESRCQIRYPKVWRLNPYLLCLRETSTGNPLPQVRPDSIVDVHSSRFVISGGRGDTTEHMDTWHGSQPPSTESMYYFQCLVHVLIRSGRAANRQYHRGTRYWYEQWSSTSSTYSQLTTDIWSWYAILSGPTNNRQ